MKNLTDQLGRIKIELDEMLKLMLDKKDHTDVAVAIFSANKEIARAEVLLMMKNLSEQQRKELGIEDPIV
jgi:hypothetical protein